MTDLESKLKALVERADKLADSFDYMNAARRLRECVNLYRRAYRASELLRDVDRNPCWQLCAPEIAEFACHACKANEAALSQAAELLEEL